MDVPWECVEAFFFHILKKEMKFWEFLSMIYLGSDGNANVYHMFYLQHNTHYEWPDLAVI